ncbi:MAG: hypothetical protein AAF170_02320 [Bacteroidota bacterium]
MTRTLLLLVGLLCGTATAQDGQIDTAFGADGYVENLPQERPIRLADLAVSPTDAAVYVGWSGRTETEAFVGRVTPEGVRDATFGADGLVVIPVDGTGETLRAVAVRADGHVLAIGQAASTDGSVPPTRLLTAQLNDQGQPETVAVLDLGESARGEGVVVSETGAYLAVSLLDSQTCGIVRLDADGVLDLAFGTDGLVVLAVGSPCEAADLALTETGVVLVGTLNDTIGTIVLAQISADGQLDTSFGDNGLATRTFDSSQNKASSLAVGPTGDLIVGGLSRKGSVAGPLLLRFDATGAPLDSFGYQGLYWSADAPSNGLYAEPPGVVALSDGRVVFATTTAPTVRLTVGGVTSDGERDLSFGTNGFTTATEAVSNFSYGRGIAVDSKGRVLVGGEAIISGSLHQLVISRLTGSIASTASEGEAPVQTGSLRIAPNPSVGHTRISTTLDKSATVQAVVLDSLGRQLATLHDGPARAGDLDLEWDASTAAPGLYVVRLLINGRPQMGTMTVAR